MDVKRRRQLAKLWLDIRTGFWLRPLLLLVTGMLAGFGVAALDRWLVARDATGWLPGGSPGGVRALLQVGAGALATTLAISLSLTMVTVQLASSQFTPRLMRRFLSDAFTQIVIGVFLATIAYTFLVLRAVRSPEEGDPFVPRLAITLAAVMTLACFGLLVVFLHRTMRGLMPATVIAAVGADTRRALHEADVRDLRPAPEQPATGPRAVVAAGTPGYVQLVDDVRVRAALARVPGVTLVWRDAGPGSFAIPGQPLVTVHGVERLDDEVVREVQASFALGSQRTEQTDVGFGVRQLVDMALRALSPGINDVTTAVMVVNELGVLARELAEHGVATGPWRVAADRDGPPYVVRVLDLDTFLGLAFGEILASARAQPRIGQRVLDVLGVVALGAAADIREVLAGHEMASRAALVAAALTPTAR